MERIGWLCLNMEEMAAELWFMLRISCIHSGAFGEKANSDKPLCSRSRENLVECIRLMEYNKKVLCLYFRRVNDRIFEFFRMCGRADYVTGMGAIYYKEGKMWLIFADKEKLDDL